MTEPILITLRCELRGPFTEGQPRAVHKTVERSWPGVPRRDDLVFLGEYDKESFGGPVGDVDWPGVGPVRLIFFTFSAADDLERLLAIGFTPAE
jgi:hypothetical protein